MIESTEDDFEDLDETLCAECGKGRDECLCYTRPKESCEDPYCLCRYEKYLICSCCYTFVCECEIQTWK